MASRALIARLINTWLHCPGSMRTCWFAALQRDGELHVLADQSAEHALGVAGDAVEIDDLWRVRGAAAEREQPSGQPGGALCRVLNCADARQARIVRPLVVTKHIRRAADHGEQVVEVVGDAASELADGLHLLRLAQLLLECQALGDLEDAGADEDVRGVGRRTSRISQGMSCPAGVRWIHSKRGDSPAITCSR